jgi:hypothetical protein
MDEGFDELSETLKLRQKLTEKHAKESEIYDFNGQSFHRELCLMPDDSHNSVS